MSDDGGPIAFNSNDGDGEDHTPSRRKNPNPFNKPLQYPGYKERTYPEPLGPWVDEMPHFRMYINQWVGLRNWPRFKKLIKSTMYLKGKANDFRLGLFNNQGGPEEIIFLMMCLQWRYRNNLNALKVRDSLIPASLDDMRIQIDSLDNIIDIPGVPEVGLGAAKWLITAFHWMRWNQLHGHSVFRNIDGYYTGYDQNPSLWRQTHEKTIWFESQAGMALTHSPYAFINTSNLRPTSNSFPFLSDDTKRKIFWAHSLWAPTIVNSNYSMGSLKRITMPLVPTTQEILVKSGLLSKSTASLDGSEFITYNRIFSNNPLFSNYPRHNPFDPSKRNVTTQAPQPVLTHSHTFPGGNNTNTLLSLDGQGFSGWGTLLVGQSLVNGIHRLDVSADGISKTTSNVETWRVNPPAGQAFARLVVQNDGYLSVYNPTGQNVKVLFAGNTIQGGPPTVVHLTLETDGSLRFYATLGGTETLLSIIAS